MAFVRRRGNSNQLIETYRDRNGSVRQRVLVNLGQYASLEEAIAAEPERFKDALKPRRREQPEVPEGKAVLGQRDRQARIALLDTLAPAILEIHDLAPTERKRNAIAAAYERVDGFPEEELPDRITTRDFAKASLRLIGWLGEFLTDVDLMPGARRRTKGERWAASVEAAVDALKDLQDLQDGYRTWRENTPDALAQGSTVDKLDAVIDLDIDSVIVAVEELADIDLPKGFGKD